MQWNEGDYNWKSRYVKSRKFERQRVKLEMLSWSFFFASSKRDTYTPSTHYVHTTTTMMMMK